MKWAEIKVGALLAASLRSLLRDAQCWRRKWGAFTRLETRTKESNRRAREKILLPVLLSY